MRNSGIETMTLTYTLMGIWLAWWAAWLVAGLGANRNAASEEFNQRLPHMAPLVLGVLLVFSPVAIPAYFELDWPDAARWLQVVGVIAGLGFATWARIHLGRNWSGLVAIKRGHQLVTTGPYRFVRHPIYTGLTFAFATTALAVNTWGAVIGSMLVLIAFLIKLTNEEKLLRVAFGGEHRRLCKSVPARLVPWCF